MPIELSDDPVMEISLEDLNADVIHVRQMVAQITAGLDEAIDYCNTSVDYERWFEGMQIHCDAISTLDTWPPTELQGGSYNWSVLYHPGNGIITHESRSLGVPAGIHYFPDPTTAISRLIGMGRAEAMWRELNPDIDLSKELFITSQVGGVHAPDVVSNELHEIMRIMFHRFAILERSRLWSDDDTENFPF